MFDAIVVGARCAGSPTAMLLARKGHRVLVLDRASFPSDVVSTHFLWPHGASYLNRWGLLDGVRAHTPTNTDFELVNEGIVLRGAIPIEDVRTQLRHLHGDDSGAVDTYMSVRRRILDKTLLDAAAGAGVEIRENVTVEELLVENGRVTGVRARTKDGRRFDEHAKIVVGADGRNSLVARSLDLKKYDTRTKCTFAYWTYWSGFDAKFGRIHRRGRLSAAAVPTNLGQNMVLVWGPGDWFDTFRMNAARNYQWTLDYVSPELGRTVRDAGVREERFFGTVDQGAYLRQLFGQGWALVGDAESFKDQCTATGMTHAFRDAELASAAIHESLATGRPMMDTMKTYENRRRSQDSAAYYDFVCTMAEMKPLRHDELLLFAALRSSQTETNRFLATLADVAPVSEFFQASNLLQLMEGVRETTSDHPIFTDFEASMRAYRVNPFAGSAESTMETPQ